MSDKKVHWETVFTTKAENEVSWYQKKPETSLDFFNNNAIPKDAKPKAIKTAAGIARMPHILGTSPSGTTTAMKPTA